MRGLWLGGILLVSVLAFFLFRPSEEQSSGLAVAITLPSATSPEVPSPSAADAAAEETNPPLREQPQLPQSGPVIEAPRELTWEERVLSLQSRPPEVTDLYLAIRNGDPAVVATVLSGGIDPNAIPESRMLLEHPQFGQLSPLFEAVLVDNMAVVDALLDGGADMDAMVQLDRTQYHTALSFALVRGKEEIAMALIGKGADTAGPVCAREYCGNMMTMAAIAGSDAVVRALVAGATEAEVAEFLALRQLQGGIEARLPATVYNSDPHKLLSRARYRLLAPILAAARYGHADVFSTLLELGADLDHRLHYQTPQSLARQHGWVAISALIEAEKEKADAFIAIVQSGDVGRVEEAVTQGANVNYAGLTGLTPLMAAVKGGDIPMARLLLSLGANPDKGPWQLQLGEDPKPLHVAIRTGQEAMVQVLLSAGADVNVTHGDEGDGTHTTLAYAVFAEDVELVRDLLARGARTDVLHCPGNDCWGDPYLNLAAGRGNIELVRMFIDAGGVVNPDRRALHPSDGFVGYSPLMAASGGGHSDVVTMLLDEFDADPLARNNAGCAAVDYAIIRGREEVVEILSAAGAVADRSGCRSYPPGQ